MSMHPGRPPPQPHTGRVGRTPVTTMPRARPSIQPNAFSFADKQPPANEPSPTGPRPIGPRSPLPRHSSSSPGTYTTSFGPRALAQPALNVQPPPGPNLTPAETSWSSRGSSHSGYDTASSHNSGGGRYSQVSAATELSTTSVSNSNVEPEKVPRSYSRGLPPHSDGAPAPALNGYSGILHGTHADFPEGQARGVSPLNIEKPQNVTQRMPQSRGPQMPPPMPQSRGPQMPPPMPQSRGPQMPPPMSQNRGPQMPHPMPSQNRGPQMPPPMPSQNRGPQMPHPMPSQNRGPQMPPPMPQNRGPQMPHPMPSQNRGPQMPPPMPQNHTPQMPPPMLQSHTPQMPPPMPQNRTPQMPPPMPQSRTPPMQPDHNHIPHPMPPQKHQSLQTPAPHDKAPPQRHQSMPAPPVERSPVYDPVCEAKAVAPPVALEQQMREMGLAQMPAGTNAADMEAIARAQARAAQRDSLNDTPGRFSGNSSLVAGQTPPRVPRKAAPRVEYAFTVFPRTVLARVLAHLEYGDFVALRAVSKRLQLFFQGPGRELALQRFLGPHGYRTLARRDDPDLAKEDMPAPPKKDASPSPSKAPPKPKISVPAVMSDMSLTPFQRQQKKRQIERQLRLLKARGELTDDATELPPEFRHIIEEPEQTSVASSAAASSRGAGASDSRATARVMPGRLRDTRNRHAPEQNMDPLDRPLLLTLRDLDLFFQAQTTPLATLAAYATAALARTLPFQKENLARSMNKAHSRVVIYLRELARWTSSDSAYIAVPYLFAASVHSLPRPVWRADRATAFRVWIPAQSSWMDDEELLECERDLWRSGAWDRLQRGDLVVNTAMHSGPNANVGTHIWDGHVLRDLSYTYDLAGHLPPWLDMLQLPTSFYHNRIASSTPNPVFFLSISPFADQVRHSLTLCEQKAPVKSQTGQFVVKGFVYRAALKIDAETCRRARRIVDPEWLGELCLETEGATEYAAELLRRAADPTPQPWRVLRSRCRPGRLWLSPLADHERLN